MYKGLTIEKLKEEIDKLTSLEKLNGTVLVTTGKGGVKDFLKAFHEEWNPNTEYNFMQMLRTYRFLVGTNNIKKSGGLYMIG